MIMESLFWSLGTEAPLLKGVGGGGGGFGALGC